MERKQSTIEPAPQAEAWQWPADLPALVDEPDQAQKNTDCAALLLAGKEKHEKGKVAS